jgi:DNA-binding response OmpR family regulator
MLLELGSVIDGRYRLESRLGSGGLASVWRVQHLQLEAPFALKILQVSTDDLRRRLLEEGRIQSRLAHPNLVRVTDTVSLPWGVGLVMELVEGPDLRTLLDRQRLPPGQALALGAGVLDGVAYAHRKGLIHRDLKPANVLLQPLDGGYVPRVVDFGLAKALRQGGGGLTRTGMGMGTPGYMAPEQYRDAAHVDARADVFSLGAILYELVTGARPFNGHNLPTLYQQATAGTFMPAEQRDPGLPRGLSELLRRALSPAPQDRFQDAGQLAARWREAAGFSRPAAEVSAAVHSAAPQPAPPPPAPETDHTLPMMTSQADMPEQLLLVEDNFPLRLSLATFLKARGYHVTAVGSAEEGELAADQQAPDIVLLDWNLPGQAGLDLLKSWRASGRRWPVIMLTARDAVADRVEGLTSGANDYIVKPFANEELLARVQVQLRDRALAPAAPPARPDELALDTCTVDLGREIVRRDGEETQLTTREAALLRYLVEHAGENVPREDLLREVWGWRARTATRALDNAVLRLRQKIEADPGQPRHVITVYGKGYRFET